MLRVLLVVGIALFFLTGCSLPVKEVPVYETVLIAPEDAQLLDCEVAPPPAKSEYLAADVQGKEKLLFEHSHAQMKNLSVCNKRWGALRAWKKDQKVLYENKPKPKGE